MLAEQADAARVAIETLSSLTRGIYPRLLSERGPRRRAAVRGGRQPDPGHRRGRRPRATLASVEAALYFCCMEAVQNAAKHSGASQVTVRLRRTTGDGGGSTVTDDGTGFDQARALAAAAGAG